MQVAIAGVEDIGDIEPVLFLNLADLDQRLAQATARHYAILHDEVRAEMSNGRKGALATFPDARAFILAIGHADFEGA